LVSIYLRWWWCRWRDEGRGWVVYAQTAVRASARGAKEIGWWGWVEDRRGRERGMCLSTRFNGKRLDEERNCLKKFAKSTEDIDSTNESTITNKNITKDLHKESSGFTSRLISKLQSWKLCISLNRVVHSLIHQPFHYFLSPTGVKTSRGSSSFLLSFSLPPTLPSLPLLSLSPSPPPM